MTKHEIDVEVAKVAKKDGWELPDANLIQFGRKVWERALSRMGQPAAQPKECDCPMCGGSGFTRKAGDAEKSNCSMCNGTKKVPWVFSGKPEPAATPGQGEPPERSLLTRLRVVGGQLRMNLKDAVTLYPEHFSAEGIEQLLAEYDAVNEEVVKFECAPPATPQVEAIAEEFAQWFEKNPRALPSAVMLKLNSILRKHGVGAQTSVDKLLDAAVANKGTPKDIPAWASTLAADSVKAGEIETQPGVPLGAEGVDVAQMIVDFGILLTELEAHQENTGESLEDDDAAIVAEIKQRYEARKHIALLPWPRVSANEIRGYEEPETVPSSGADLDKIAKAQQSRMEHDAAKEQGIDVDELRKSAGTVAQGAREWPGIERIAAERKRQIEKEGWTPEHDAQHKDASLAAAAACYASIAATQGSNIKRNYQDGAPRRWPWDEKWWKPSDDPIRNLEKAGALIAAEIDRLLLPAQPSAGPSGAEEKS